MKRSLSKKERIKKNSEIRTVLNKGQKFSVEGARLFVYKNQLDYIRFAVVLRRNFGKAIIRNREKRRMREIFRLYKDFIMPGYDFVLLCYPGNFDYKDRSNQFTHLIEKAKSKTG